MEKNLRRLVTGSTEQLVGKVGGADLELLAPFRARRGWSLRPDGAGDFWLRAPAADQEDFRKLPLLGRWSLSRGGALVRAGNRLPEALLPADDWSELEAWLSLAPPLRNAPAAAPERLAFRLSPSGEDRPAVALLCAMMDFAAWADTALAPRLERLRFACNEAGGALVMGEPLPGLPGEPCYATGRLLLPCGWSLPPHVWPELAEELLGLGLNRMGLLRADGSSEEMSEEHLVPATRTAIRLTARSLAAS